MAKAKKNAPKKVALKESARKEKPSQKEQAKEGFRDIPEHLRIPAKAYKNPKKGKKK